MEVTIDTKSKTIQVSQGTNLEEFIKEIKDLLPKEAKPEEWFIIPATINYPIINPVNPWECPSIPWGHIPTITYSKP